MFPHSTTLESNVKILRMMEMITNLRGLLIFKQILLGTMENVGLKSKGRTSILSL